MKNRHFIPLSLLIMLFAICGCDSDPKTEASTAAPEKAIRVGVVEVVPVTIEDMLTLPGETVPDKDVCVSSESAGTVVWLGVKEGDTVRKGQLIARLDGASSGAKFDRAKAAKKLAAEQLRRRKELLNKGVLAQEEYDQIKAELEQSEASLKEMMVNVEYGIVRAPISGVINKRYIDRGERLEVGANVVDIVDSSTIKTYINVPEMDISYIKKGQKVSVSVDALPGKKWEGVIDFVSFKADRFSKTFEVKVLTDNKAGEIRAGMLARVSLLRRTVTDAVTTPLSAIINQGGERIIYVEKDGLAHVRTVELGIIDGDRAQITKGLKAGEKLITAGHTMVEDGMKVVTQ
ncbi:efflux RND transporter periplasmic adaptor subunit [Desulfovibrio sp. JC010]|uniref:efflux RND transporter periplasmic adaptor subunit n=1 Tax=Desulfovibrio sp. JC010 TaxID=2593641 RepID=UPI0013D6CB74|nr:efflux RND transporter periplasmic adaptor subunit [Desulfovibrio sp. JC010]NDV25211.1 efflux RND transporter periplasmic adaptor subunit [Desulfovibrio sp. JC010]